LYVSTEISAPESSEISGTTRAISSSTVTAAGPRAPTRPDVEQIRARRQQRAAPVHALLQARLGPVRERIRRGIEDSHQPRAPAELQPVLAGAQDHLRILSFTSLRVTLPALSTAATFNVNFPAR
jgi:hypothetical protein